MPYARTQDGVRIYYEKNGRGTPLVLAYGIGGNADLWDVNRDALAAKQDPRLQADRALAGHPLRQSRSARRVEPRGPRLPGQSRRASLSQLQLPGFGSGVPAAS